MTSFTKPEVHGTSHCRQKRTEPRPQVTCTENLVNLFGRVCFEMRTERQTDMSHGHADRNTLFPHQQRNKHGHKIRDEIAYMVARMSLLTLIDILLEYTSKSREFIVGHGRGPNFLTIGCRMHGRIHGSKWGTNHGEREERGPESAEEIRCGEGCPLPTGKGFGKEAMPPPQKIVRFLSSKWQVLVHSGS